MTKTEAPYEVAQELLDFLKVAVNILSKPWDTVSETDRPWLVFNANKYFNIMADVSSGRAVII